ncbi:MAG: HAMP domain-containing histidine kinase [Chloroflexi bacterium]|nr:HAMP domain-containing histidine kinase [Chloroflexota bacterium]
MSLRTRLVLAQFFVILLTLAIVAVSLVVILRQYQIVVQRARLGDAVVPLAFQARAMFQQGLDPAAVLARLDEQAGDIGRVFIVDENGLVLADAANGLTGRTVRLNPPAQARDYVWGEHLIRNRAASFTLLFAALPAGQSGGRNVYVALTQAEAPILRTLDGIGLSLVVAGIVTFLVALLVALILARSIAEPITRLTRATEAIARGQYEHRVTANDSDEIGRLGMSFNAMAEQVQHSRQMEKDFLANVSHELKTPLTSIQGFAQAILEGAVHDAEGVHRAAQTIFDETARMGRLVGDLLTLARFESGQLPLEHETVDLAQLLPRWVDRFRPRASELGEAIVTVVEPMPAITGDASRLEQVVNNLVENALKYNHDGGTVTVNARAGGTDAAGKGASALHRRLSARGSNEWITIVVSDTGAGIPAEDLPRLFDRFYRGDKARAAGGSGLGLSIVNEIVRAHGGRMQVESAQGRGSTFTVYLPIRNDAHA